VPSPCTFVQPKRIFFRKSNQYFLRDAEGATLTLPSQISLQFEYNKKNNFPMASSKNSALTIMDFDAFTSQLNLNSSALEPLDVSTITLLS